MKKAVVLLADGFEEIEALTVVDVLKRADVCCDMCSIKEDKEVNGAHNIKVKSDVSLNDIDSKYYDAIVIPGGMPGSTNLRDDQKVIDLVKSFNDDYKIVAAICAGPIVLGKAKLLKGKKATSYPGFEKELEGSMYKEDLVVQDGNIITSRGPAVAIYFALKILENLVTDKEKVLEVKKGMLLDLVEDNMNK